MPELPQRLTERSFRRFEQTIATAVREFPRVVIVSPGDLSSLTVAARLRDAMSSFYRYEWETKEIDVDKFRREYRNIIVSHRGTSIYVGSREAIRMYDPLHPIVALTEEMDRWPSGVFWLSDCETKLVARLASTKMLNRPVSLRMAPGFETFDPTSLEDDFDVVVEKNDDGSFTIS